MKKFAQFCAFVGFLIATCTTLVYGVFYVEGCNPTQGPSPSSSTPSTPAPPPPVAAGPITWIAQGICTVISDVTGNPEVTLLCPLLDENGHYQSLPDGGVKTVIVGMPRERWLAVQARRDAGTGTAAGTR